ncbi:Fatty acyl-CoA reductase (plasmid) [Streptomyces sp. ADI95-16]|uniref:oxidoreductase n=1 Tax=unclassified Streptomyces TaxID=2593676 RepID=UPI000F3A7FB4|nr:MULTISPECIES: oxidoreductase [unclassified Streptomyces]AYV33134.1 Fatty acyl-CoA reductase [Streptomyces sp. ADI95-16]RPK23946.1 Fatty acyl-CoA reductase [Streptomyces sp. ADI91-18]
MVWSTADVPDQRGRTVLITGASGGLGLETARVLAARGARVVLACRDIERGIAAAARIGGLAEVVRLDLASLASVRETAAQVHSRVDRLDLLVNNAGVMFPPYAHTRDGFEAHLGVNHLGHFALTGLLLGLMREVPGSRVVTVSSLAHRLALRGARPEESHATAGHRSVVAYGRSKLANLMFAQELQRRLADSGAETVSVAAHPGLSPTGLWHRGAPPWLRPVSLAALRWLAQDPAGAALPSLRAATDPLVDGGSYLGPVGLAECSGGAVPARSSRSARDEVEQIRLWQLSQELTGVRFAWGASRRPAVKAVR